ncbi:hypothetical protein LSAT2_008752 [Lamellibrachia satsuma]|nr:hypothetical protein LSAT2_008752 [Lamellibrachia satsuma]
MCPCSDSPRMSKADISAACNELASSTSQASPVSAVHSPTKRKMKAEIGKLRTRLDRMKTKVKAATSVQITPQNVTELKSFLGMVQYYQKFLPNLATTLAPLHRLLQKGVTWAWKKKADHAFQTVKSHLASCQLLAHYDPNLPVHLACDVSPYGVSAVLSHIMPDGSEKPVAYASRSLATSETNYS